ncbi:alternate-type signal peptide domain-containing protein [Cryobacterium zhongshanensis]|uniref:Alternate-type signal peptide domain-containing protein n=1 Tax=Cryobacterium zhongshanensis TaxID=2928153 RepID=A0AA41UFM5_9MICO|nr:alternate-type signal peptide domain-containing protein [Cryobacterium zhongshanensis]MCI4656334.1 alternate-type signal peptide domain-containing protein [Cryobacterium zhongshanensis]
MNKLLKGSIAGAVGVALLLGGGGTLALWNNSAVAAGGSVTSGVLTIASTGAAAWKNISADAVPAAAAISDITAYKIVPGDKLELTQTVTINATGNNLTALLTYDPLTIVTTNPAGAALKSALTYTMDATGGSNVSRVTGTNTFAVTPSTSTSTVTVKFTVELPSTTTGAVAQAGTINLSALGFSLTQTRP